MSKKDKSLVKLDSGREVKLKEMSLDEIDYCTDIVVMEYEDGEPKHIKNMAKARTAWIRRGIKGGEFDDFELDKKGLVSDDTIKQMTDSEKIDVCLKIQDYQRLGK
tara:strand:+ start:452 stop:769 length:318 start_codon:yes stop_codon:yes gene_type:complete